MSPLLQERATPAAAQPLQPLPLGEEQQLQLEREDSDSDSSGEDSDTSLTFGELVCVCSACVVGVASEGQPLAVCCVWLVLCVMSSLIEASV